MKLSIQCPACQFKLSAEMKNAMTKGECPSCGAKIDMTDTVGVMEFLGVVNTLKLPLTPQQLQDLISAYFVNMLGLSNLAPIAIEEEMKDKISKLNDKDREEIAQNGIKYFDRYVSPKGLWNTVLETIEKYNIKVG